VAIKTMDFRAGPDGGVAEDTAPLAQEAAIAINLVHRNLVATYYTDVRQARPQHTQHSTARVGGRRGGRALEQWDCRC